MGKPKKKHKKAKQLPLSKEEQIFQAARDLAAEIGISYSEALGFTLGIKDVTYGWEEDYTEEEFQALIDLIGTKQPNFSFSSRRIASSSLR